MRNSWRTWACALKRNTYALYLAARHRSVPVMAKVMTTLVAAYALSPIDLIPDFAPVLGYLDDMILLTLGIPLAIKLAPEPIWEECHQRAELELSNGLPHSRMGAVVMIAIWIVAIWIVASVIFRVWIDR